MGIKIIVIFMIVFLQQNDLYRILNLIRFSICFSLLILSYNKLSAQNHHIDDHHSFPVIKDVEAQPLLHHALSVGEALTFIGSDLPDSAIKQLRNQKVSQFAHHLCDPVRNRT